jgi:hypothetical protein
MRLPSLATGFGKSRMALPDGQLQRDTAVVVEGRSLSLLGAQGEVIEAFCAPEEEFDYM